MWPHGRCFDKNVDLFYVISFTDKHRYSEFPGIDLELWHYEVKNKWIDENEELYKGLSELYSSANFSCLEYFVDRSYSRTFQTCIISGAEIEISIHGCNNDNMFHMLKGTRIQNFNGKQTTVHLCNVAEFSATISIEQDFFDYFMSQNSLLTL